MRREWFIMRLLRQKCSKLQRAANKVTALTTLLLVHSVNVVTNKLTCCAGTAPCTVPEHVAESVIRVQSSANSASATATHIFPRFSPQKPKKALQTPSRIKVVPGKLSGLWTWIKDPTGFDAASDRLKAQHRAGKVSRAKVLKQCLNGETSPSFF